MSEAVATAVAAKPPRSPARSPERCSRRCTLLAAIMMCLVATCTCGVVLLIDSNLHSEHHAIQEAIMETLRTTACNGRTDGSCSPHLHDRGVLDARSWSPDNALVQITAFMRNSVGLPEGAERPATEAAPGASNPPGGSLIAAQRAAYDAIAARVASVHGRRRVGPRPGGRHQLQPQPLATADVRQPQPAQGKVPAQQLARTGPSTDGGLPAAGASPVPSGVESAHPLAAQTPAPVPAATTPAAEAAIITALPGEQPPPAIAVDSNFIPYAASTPAVNTSNAAMSAPPQAAGVANSSDAAAAAIGAQAAVSDAVTIISPPPVPAEHPAAVAASAAPNVSATVPGAADGNANSIPSRAAAVPATNAVSVTNSAKAAASVPAPAAAVGQATTAPAAAKPGPTPIFAPPAGSSQPAVAAVAPGQGNSTQPPYKFAFKLHPFGSLTMDSVKDRLCPGDVSTTYPPVDSRLKMLFVLGTQKGGTTFLFRALDRHPAFIGAQHAYGQPPGEWRKEVHYFNRFPPPPGDFLSCFDPQYTNLPVDVAAEDVEHALVDGTPDYMFSAMAPPRMKALVPQARFVIVLRDPVARVYSAYKMTKRYVCRNPAQKCEFPPFRQVVMGDVLLRKRDSCFFDTPDGSKDWFDCNKCFNSHRDLPKCLPKHKDMCTLKGTYTTCDVSNYAAQIAMWLSFFPPDRFLILTSRELRDPDSQVKALNRLLLHMGMRGEPFTHKMLEGVVGYDGNKLNLSAADREGFTFLRAAMRQSVADLEQLLRLAGIDFHGIPDEDIAATSG